MDSVDSSQRALLAAVVSDGTAEPHRSNRVDRRITVSHS